MELAHTPIPVVPPQTPRTARTRSAAPRGRARAERDVVVALLLLYSVFLSPYLSSWLPALAGYPTGAAIRELAIIVFIANFYPRLLTSMPLRRNPAAWLYTLVIVFGVISFTLTESSLSQFVIGVNSFIAYPAAFSMLYFATHTAREDGRQPYLLRRLKKHLPVIFIFVASLGTLDVAANGHLIELLGYQANYGGAEFSLVTRYYDTVRANAGIGDALAFGYLMTAATVYFLNEIKVRGLSAMALGGAAICTVACLLTLTRGAIAATALAYVFFLMSPRGLLILFLVFGAALAGITASSQYTDLFLGRFTDSDEGSAYSSELRVIMAEASIDFLANNPVGIGIGTQGAGNLLSDTDLRLNTDNYFFHMFLELGLSGGLIFLAFLAAQIRLFLRRKVCAAGKISMVSLLLITSALSSSIAFATLCVPYWMTLLLLSEVRPARR